MARPLRSLIGLALTLAALPASAGVALSVKHTNTDGTTDTITQEIEGPKLRQQWGPLQTLADVQRKTMTLTAGIGAEQKDVPLAGDLSLVWMIWNYGTTPLKPTGARRKYAGHECEEYAGRSVEDAPLTTCLSRTAPGAAEYTAFVGKLADAMPKSADENAKTRAIRENLPSNLGLGMPLHTSSGTGTVANKPAAEIFEVTRVRSATLSVASFAAVEAAPASKLAIEACDVLDRPDGPRRATPDVRPGDAVVLRCLISGYGVDKLGQYAVNVRFNARDPEGVDVVEPFYDPLRGTPPRGRGPLVEHLQVRLPTYAPPGEYRLTVGAEDAVGGKTVEYVRTLKVETASPAPAAKGLEMRRYEYARSKDGPAVDPPVFRPGETVHVRFEVAGFKFHGKNADTHVSLRILNPDGKVVAEQIDSTTIHFQSYYRPDTVFVPVDATLRLPETFGPGTYTQQYVVLDKMDGNRTATFQTRFEVRNLGSDPK